MSQVPVSLVSRKSSVRADACSPHQLIDPETLLGEIGKHLETVLSAAGMDVTSAKIAVVAWLAATGTEDDDHLYLDGECDNSLPHRRYAANAARSVLQQSPNESGQLESLGMSLIKLGDYQSALACFTRQAEIAPENGYPWNNIAWCKLRLGRAKEAQTACQRALQTLTNHPHVCHDHACILLALGRLDESLSAVDRAIARRSAKAPQLHYLRACVLERKGDSKQAVRAWETYLKEIRTCPSHWRAADRALKHLQALHTGLSNWRVRRLRAKMGPPRTTTASVLRALGLDVPDDAARPSAQDEFRGRQADKTALAGWRLFQRGNRSAAERKCRRALECWPFSPLARILDARLALQRKDEETYQKYVALATLEQLFAPTAEARVRALAAFVFLMMLVHAEKKYHDGDHPGALFQLDQVDAVFPNHATAIFLRGLVLAAQGDKAGARDQASRLRGNNGDQQAVDMLMRAGRESVPRETASASSPISVEPSGYGLDGLDGLRRRLRGW